MPKYNPKMSIDTEGPVNVTGSRLPIYTLDLETDPFKKDEVPEPFCAGLYDGQNFEYTWGDDCVKQMTKKLAKLPPGIVYVHNGGKFDFFYTMEWFDGKMMMINGRIVRTESKIGHEFRDSYAIMPFALSQYKKDDIDYKKLSKWRRNANRPEILAYLKSDCVYLWQLCTDFVSTFGAQITIGSTAMKELQKVHTFEKLPENIDADIRERFYYGGRVQCFEKGDIKRNIKVYDVNSMYPYTMRDFSHPIGCPSHTGDKITRDTCFIVVKGKNHGAFPMRMKDDSLRFDVPEGIFSISIHEYKVALQYGLFETEEILETVDFYERITFSKFVNKFYKLRVKAKEMKDESHALFYKYVLNSSYGKFAQNPRNYFDYKITTAGTLCTGWEADFIVDDKYVIWKQKSSRFVRHNVATAASITGAARAVLLEAIAKAKGLIYCDTDSVICSSLPGVRLHGSDLGAWKLEAEGTRAAIGGKKLYAIFDSDKKRIAIAVAKAKKENKKIELEVNGSLCVKQANKGVKLTPNEIIEICEGEIITYEKQSPTYKWSGEATFLTRKVRMLENKPPLPFEVKKESGKGILTTVERLQ